MSKSNTIADSPLCPVCEAVGAIHIYSQSEVPVHSVRLAASRAEALAVNKGDMDLLACQQCDFVWNACFDAATMHYDQCYEETQAFSGTFNAWQSSMAERLISKYGLADKSVIEIGCGKGDFLTELVALGMGSGTGYDPSFRVERLDPDERLSFVVDFFPPQSFKQRPTADVYWCKMTLEHIEQPLRFIRELRSYIGEQHALVIFQVPALERILEEKAFWDIFYEHCNYFSKHSLCKLFELAGFEVLEIETLYASQYLSLVARPAADGEGAKPARNLHPRLNAEISLFRNRTEEVINDWRRVLQPSIKPRSILIWGAASKAVALLNRLPELQQAVRLVDINPHKQGTFLPSTELEIETPEAISGEHFELILVANPVYQEEILNQLKALAVSGKLISLGELPTSSMQIVGTG